MSHITIKFTELQPTAVEELKNRIPTEIKTEVPPIYGLKCLTSGYKGIYSSFEWPLPKIAKAEKERWSKETGEHQDSYPGEDQPGEWVRVDGPLVPCKRGIHASDLNHLGIWFRAVPFAKIYIIELEDLHPQYLTRKRKNHNNKVLARSGRLIRELPLPEMGAYGPKTVGLIHCVSAVLSLQEQDCLVNCRELLEKEEEVL